MLGHKDFDKEFKKTEKMAVVGMVISVTLSLGVLVFVGWVVVKTMLHFGVI